MPNRICGVVTQTVQRDGRETPMIMMGLDIDDLASLDQFMTEVVTTFRNHRMCSPPETSMLLITLIGALDAEGFKERWTREVERDPILAIFMRQMTVAAALHGTADGQVLAEASLI